MISCFFILSMIFTQRVYPGATLRYFYTQLPQKPPLFMVRFTLTYLNEVFILPLIILNYHLKIKIIFQPTPKILK